jgi:hypothetical protein
LVAEVPLGFAGCLFVGIVKEIADFVDNPTASTALDSFGDLLANGVGWSNGTGAALFGSSPKKSCEDECTKSFP